MHGPYASMGQSAGERSCLRFHESALGSKLDADFGAEFAELRELVSALTVTFKEEKAQGAVLDNSQDPVSFSRLDRRIKSILKAYSQGNCGDWRKYAVWSEHGYVRHLLWETEEFELMVLCWKGGQTSRIHSHADSHCWLTVLDGEVRETQYQPLTTAARGSGGVVPTPAAAALGPGDHNPGTAGCTLRLQPTKLTEMRAGDVAYINDNIALHSVGCPAAGDEAAGDPAGETARDGTGDGSGAINGCGGGCGPLACTLHLYCPPIRRAKAYEGGRVVDYIPGFMSRHSVCDP